MSDTNTPADGVEDDLDLFSADFFGQKEVPPTEPASSQEEEDAVSDDDDAPEASEETDTHDVEDAPETGDDSDEGEDKPEGKEEPKKKNRFQERIDEVVGKQREAERRAAEFEQKLNDALAKLESKDNVPAPAVVKTDSDEPAADDKNEDGTDKYPLGEFDPRFIKDLTKYAFESQRISVEEQAKQEAEQRQADEAKAALQAGWQEKLGPAQERYPDFQEKGEELLAGFSDLDQAYGEYLSARLMDMDYGPDVLYYLASNPDEARQIVNSGPAKATLALGRIEAKFMFADEEKKQARPKTSKAPPPPPHANKGSGGAVIEVPDDTDDLDAFSRKLFKKK